MKTLAIYTTLCTSLVSIRPHSSAHSGDSNTSPYIAKSALHPVVHLVGTGDVVLVVLALAAGQINSARTLDSVPANLWRVETDMPFYSTGPRWSDATDRAGYSMTTTTTTMHQICETVYWLTLYSIKSRKGTKNIGQNTT